MHRFLSDSRKLLQECMERREEKKREELVERRDLSNIDDWNKKIEGFLRLKGKDEHTRALRKLFQIWRELSALREENDIAEMVLAAVYRQGKIKDYLDKAAAFAQEIEETDTAQAAREMGYYNYIYFLRQFTEEMKEKYAEQMTCREHGVPESNAENVVWMIRSECSGVSSLKDLPKAREAVKRLMEAAEIGRPKTEQIKKDIGFVSGTMELLAADDTEEMEAVRNRLIQRVRAIEENIAYSRRVYEITINMMTEEWFDAFLPDSESINEMSKEELKAFYIDRLQELQEQLSAEE